MGLKYLELNVFTIVDRNENYVSKELSRLI
jgi:hypothetical protein